MKRLYQTFDPHYSVRLFYLVGDIMKSVCFEVLKVDCILEGESWITNDVDVIGCFSTNGNCKRALMRFLNQHGFKFKKGTTLIEDDGDYITVIDRKTKRPLFDARYKDGDI